MKDKTLKILLIVLGCIFAVLLVVLLVLLLRPGEKAEDVSVGISYLESLEEKDPEEELASRPGSPEIQTAENETVPFITEDASADSTFRTEPAESSPETEPTEISSEEPSAGPSEDRLLIEKIRNEEVDIWSLFHDYVILGDSRAVGFWYFDFLPEENCLTGGGDTIKNIEMNLDGIISRNPRYIFLCYGLNDVSIGYWNTPEEYVEEMMADIAMLQEKLPDATVVVSSILPARDPAFDLSSKWRNIPQFSAAVGEACRKAGVIFVDNDAISEEHADWWQPDGIHVRQEFYPCWARNLIIGIIEGGAYE